MAELIGPYPARPEVGQYASAHLFERLATDQVLLARPRRCRCIICWVARSGAPIRCAMNLMQLAVCENLVVCSIKIVTR